MMSPLLNTGNTRVADGGRGEKWGLGVRKGRGIGWFLGMMSSFKNVLQAVERGTKKNPEANVI